MSATGCDPKKHQEEKKRKENWKGHQGLIMPSKGSQTIIKISTPDINKSIYFINQQTSPMSHRNHKENCKSLEYMGYTENSQWEM